MIEEPDFGSAMAEAVCPVGLMVDRRFTSLQYLIDSEMTGPMRSHRFCAKT
jgi:hypothetical protein